MGSPASVGGMETKIKAAKMATQCGIPVWIGSPKGFINLCKGGQNESIDNGRGRVRRVRVSR
jgi:glutamate 5-kinase